MKKQPSRLLLAMLNKLCHLPSCLWLWRYDNRGVYKELI